MKKALALAEKLNIKVEQEVMLRRDISRLKSDNPDNKIEVSGQWTSGKTIKINPRKADAYTILHEIGHVLNGYMCCREHCEYAAHGAAIALARSNGIRLPVGSKTKIDVYAGCSSREACGAIEKQRRQYGNG